MWEQEVLTFAVTLRALGIDADLDLFHQHERGVDWSRYGTRRVADSDVVVVAVSIGWRERWEGRNDPRSGAGAAAEADALLSWFERDQQDFRRRLVLAALPSMIDSAIVPDRLSGVSRVEVPDFSERALEPLMRLLLTRPKYELPQLGQLPDLAPIPTNSGERPEENDTQELREHIDLLGDMLQQLPKVEASPGADLPWNKARSQVVDQLTELEQLDQVPRKR